MVEIVETLKEVLSSRELRANLSSALGRTSYAGERIGISRNGKVVAVLIDVEDLEALETFEMQQDIAAYDEAKRVEDESTVSVDEMLNELGITS